MTIQEAYDILSSVKESPMFSGQKKRLDNIAEKVGGIIKDLTAAHDRQKGKTSGHPYIKSPSEYSISSEFERHLETLSRLDSAKQWTEAVAYDVGIELDKSKEYIEICTKQADGFVEELRQEVCVDIADITLDGESKQWITTIVGLIIDIFLLVLYGLFVFKIGPFKCLQIDDAKAGFISELASVLTILLTLIICRIINRWMIKRYDKNHAIKYSELVRASKERGPFKKSMMLMSFGGDFEEIKKRDLEIYTTTSELLKYSITSESILSGNSQKLDILRYKADILEDCAKKANEQLRQSLCNEQELKKQVSVLTSELQVAREEASKERQQFHDEASALAKSHQRELERANDTIKHQKEKIDMLEKKMGVLHDEVGAVHEEVSLLPAVIDGIAVAQRENWKCKVCYGENASDKDSCKYCGVVKSIADNIVEQKRLEFVPQLVRGGYYCNKSVICLPKNYNGDPLIFDPNILYSPKIISVPKEVSSINKSDLLSNISLAGRDEIEIFFESTATKYCQ